MSRIEVARGIAAPGSTVAVYQHFQGQTTIDKNLSRPLNLSPEQIALVESSLSSDDQIPAVR